MTAQKTPDRRSKANPLPMDVIRESLTLDPKSPSFLRWIKRPLHHFKSESDSKRWNSRFDGNPAGCEGVDGFGRVYFRVRFKGNMYFAHRIVYALVHGVDAGRLQIDHIDGDGRNNKPSNLRLATNSENAQNRGTPRNNTSGRKGVYWHKPLGKWYAQIKINRRGTHLGLFDSLDEASAAYETAARQHFGQFYQS